MDNSTYYSLSVIPPLFTLHYWIKICSMNSILVGFTGWKHDKLDPLDQLTVINHLPTTCNPWDDPRNFWSTCDVATSAVCHAGEDCRDEQPPRWRDGMCCPGNWRKRSPNHQNPCNLLLNGGFICYTHSFSCIWFFQNGFDQKSGTGAKNPAVHQNFSPWKLSWSLRSWYKAPLPGWIVLNPIRRHEFFKHPERTWRNLWNYDDWENPAVPIFSNDGSGVH